MSEPTALPGITLNKPTAVRVQQLVQQAPDTTNEPASAPPRRQVGWVRTTSATASSGWYPAVITTMVDGGWVDAADVCEVQGANGETLTLSNRYWCERTGASSSNVMRFVVGVGAIGRDLVVVTDLSCDPTTGALTVTKQTVRVLA